MDGMMADREKRTGQKIKEGYCFETDSIEGPLLAAEKQRRAKAKGYGLHYFCTTQDCAYPLIPCFARRRDDYDIAWFTNHRRGPNTPPDHIPGCPNAIGSKKLKTSGNGVSRPPLYDPELESDLFIPEHLVHPSERVQQRWSDRTPPSPEELRRLVNAAQGRPVRGSLEDVMKAERAMSEDYKVSKIEQREAVLQKSDHLLIISGHKTNYKDGIVQFAMIPEHPEDRPESYWDTHVVGVLGIPKKDQQVPGGYYINPVKQGSNFHLWIQTRLCSMIETKAYLSALLEEFTEKQQPVYCYWWGLRSKVSRSGKQYLRIEDDEAIQRIALMRPHERASTEKEDGVRPA